MGRQSSLRERLRADIRRVPIIDNHEHLLMRDFPGVERMHLIRHLSHTCLRHDLRSAGLRAGFWERFWQPSSAPEDPAADWRALHPYLRAVRSTSYYHYLLAAYRDLFGFEAGDLDDDNWEALSVSIEEAYHSPDWAIHVLRDRCRVTVALNDETMGGLDAFLDARCFRPVFQVDPFLTGDPNVTNVWGTSVNAMARRWGLHARDFQGFLATLDEGFRRSADAGAVAMKVNAAYWRTLRFQSASKLEAERNYNLIVRGQYGGDPQKVGDFVLGYCIERSAELGWPVQVHTGMQTGSGNWLEYAKPTHLNRLFLSYPQARFEIFHAAYPYADEAAVLAKLFPNVYLDLCWLPLISPRAAAEGLSRWLELIPNNKLLWGGDSRVVEQTYGSVLALEDTLAEVLADKIERGYFDLDLAVETSENIMWRNAGDLFGLRQQAEKRRGNGHNIQSAREAAR